MMDLREINLAAIGFVPDDAFIYMLDYYDESLVFGGDVAGGSDVAFAFVRANMVSYQNFAETNEAYATRMLRPVRPFDATRGRWALTVSGRVDIARQIPRRNPGLSNWVALRWRGSVVERDMRNFELQTGATINRSTMQITNFAFNPAAIASISELAVPYAMSPCGRYAVRPGANPDAHGRFAANDILVSIFSRDFIEVRPRPNPAAIAPAGRTPMNPRELPSVADQAARITGGVPNDNAYFINLRGMGRVFYDLTDHVFRNRSDETVEAFFATDRGVRMTASRPAGNGSVFMSQLRPMDEVAFGPDRMPSGVQGMMRIASAEFDATRLMGTAIVAHPPADLIESWNNSGFPSLPVRFRVGAPGRAPQAARIMIQEPRNAIAPITIRGIGPAMGVVLQSTNQNINGNFRTNVVWHNGGPRLLPVAAARATEAQRPYANALVNNMPVGGANGFDALISAGIASMTQVGTVTELTFGRLHEMRGHGDISDTTPVESWPQARDILFRQGDEFVFTLRALPVEGRRLMSTPVPVRLDAGLYLQGVGEREREMTIGDVNAALRPVFANNSAFRTDVLPTLWGNEDAIKAALLAAARGINASSNIELAIVVPANGVIQPATTEAAGVIQRAQVQITNNAVTPPATATVNVPNLNIPMVTDPAAVAIAAARTALLEAIAEAEELIDDADETDDAAAITVLEAAIAAAQTAADYANRTVATLEAALAALETAIDVFEDAIG
jgi:hypothetical protein